MVGDLRAGYPDKLSAAQAEELARVNGPGLAALRAYLASGQAVAFLGAGVSAPLYPLWDGLIGELVAAASARLTDKQAATCRALASSSPESAVEIVRHSLGPGGYLAVLRTVLRVRTGPESGRSAPRGLVPAHCAALAARARARAAQAAAAGSADPIYQGRDAADAALRLAVRHNLAWHELDALRAHAALDHAERTDRGWAAKADALHTRLVPANLDPDPLGTVERLVAAQKAVEQATAGADEGDD